MNKLNVKKDRVCKYCGKVIKKASVSDIANHSRWCESNTTNGDKGKASLSKAQRERPEKIFGPFKKFTVKCFNCGDDFIVEEREKQFPRKEKYFCSVSCAHSQGGNARSDLLEQNNQLGYRSICLKYHDSKCVICGEEKILSIHHFDENNKNNSPENLIPLCPTHHQYWHSRYKNLVENKIIEYRNSFIEQYGALG